MAEKRVTVWVQEFQDRENLVLQWTDPATGKRKSAETADPKKAEKVRADLEYEMNHGKYQEVSRMTWAAFRELFGAEYVAHRRPETRKVYSNVLNLFERICAGKKDCPPGKRFDGKAVQETGSGENEDS